MNMNNNENNNFNNNSNFNNTDNTNNTNAVNYTGSAEKNAGNTYGNTYNDNSYTGNACNANSEINKNENPKTDSENGFLNRSGSANGQTNYNCNRNMPGSTGGYGYNQTSGGFGEQNRQWSSQNHQWSSQNQQFHSQDMNDRFAGSPKAAKKIKKPKKPMSKTGKYAVALTSCAVIGLACGVGGSFLGNSLIRNGVGTSTTYEGSRASSVIDVKNIDTSKEMTPAEVYAANVKSTVGITTSVTTNYFGFQTTAAASGSGFIFSEDGYILTNYHVIEDASTITVTDYDGQTYNAALVGYDESNDIAVLKIDASNLTPVILGDSSNMNVGDEVIAIGNPLGELTFSLTEGVVSALNRQVTLSSGVTMNLIQTDCAINSGNSGGALFNLYGEVIGITNAKYSSSSSSSSSASIDNIGFAIPINSVKSIVESIIEKGYVTKPYLGVTVGDVSSESVAYGLPEGAAIASVSDGTPAAEAGLQANDIVTAVNGTAISSAQDLISYVEDCSAGDVLTLTVYRQGETKEIKATLGEYTQSALPDTGSDSSSSNSSAQNGYGGQNGQSGQNGYDDGSQSGQGSSGNSGGSLFPRFN